MSSNEYIVTPFSAAVPVNATITTVDGASAGGNASSSKPTISGSGEPGSVVNLYDGVRWLGSAVVAANGAWSITAATALKAGSHALTVIGVGADGVNTLSSDPFRVNVPIDPSTVPPAPAIGSIIDHTGPVTGNVAPGGSTDDPKPTFTGSGAKPGDIVTVSDNGTPIGSSTVDASGNWSVTPTNPLGNGPHTITATEKNPSTGGTSTPSPTVTINVDTTVPSKPGTVIITDPNTGANVPSGGTSGSPNPVISGSGAKPGDIITVSDNGTPIASTTVKPDGTWSVTPSPALGEGAHNITATETNPATGAISTPSTVLPITVDSSVPAAPAIGTIIDHTGPVTGPIAPGSTTDDTKPTFSGSGAKPGDIVTIKDGSTPIGSATVDASGNWSVTPATALGNGSHTVTATESNPATGATSTPSPSVTIGVDTRVPDAPSIGHITDPLTGNNVPDGGFSTSPAPVISGSGAKPGDIITIIDGNKPVGSSTVDANGNWSVTPPLGSGSHNITATESNPATGATSPNSHGVSVVVDNAAAASQGIYQPTIDWLQNTFVSAQTSGWGYIVNGGTRGSSTGYGVLTGTGHPGDIIQVYCNGKSVGDTTIVNQYGGWSLTLADYVFSAQLAPGKYILSAVAVNPAVPVASAPAEFEFHVKSDSVTAYAEPPGWNALFAHGNEVFGGYWQGTAYLIDDPLPVIRGSGHIGDIVKLYDNSTLIGSTMVAPNGFWSFKPTSPLSDGHHIISMTGSASNLAEGGSGVPLSLDIGKIPAYWGDNSASTKITGAIVTGAYDHTGAQGMFLAGATTDDSQPTLSGLCGDQSGPQAIYDNGAMIGVSTYWSTFSNGVTVGSWSFTPSKPLSAGVHTFTAGSINGPAFTFTVGSSDAAPNPSVAPYTPDVPATIDWVSDTNGPVTGAITAGGSIEGVKTTVHGNGTYGDYVSLYLDGTLQGTAFVNTTGWSITLPAAVSAGSHVLTVVAANDSWDVAATPSPAFQFNVAPEPAGPFAQKASFVSLTDHAGNVTGTLTPAAFMHTDDRLPTINGKGSAGDTVNVYDNGALLGTAKVATTGDWWFTPSTPLSSGHHVVTATTSANGKTTSLSPEPLVFDVKVDALHSNQPFVAGLTAHNVGAPNSFASSGQTISDSQPVINGGGTDAGVKVYIYDNGTLIGSTVAYAANISSDPAMWTFTPGLPFSEGFHTITVKGPTYVSEPFTFNVHSAVTAQTSEIDIPVVHDDSAHVTVLIDTDPSAHFQSTDAHVQGDHSGLDTIALTGDHQVLDLSALIGQTAAAKISGVEVFDLGGHQNTLKVSLIDVLNLGEKDLFVKDGEQQVMVKGAAGDSVDLSNTHIAGVADGQWQQHGTAVVDGVTFNVFEHSGAHVELLVQQGVATTVHQ